MAVNFVIEKISAMEAQNEENRQMITQAVRKAKRN